MASRRLVSGCYIILPRYFSEFRSTTYVGKNSFKNDLVVSPVNNIYFSLIAFYSSGFPLEKAIAFSKKYKPFLINDLEMQRNIRDREKVKYGVNYLLSVCDLSLFFCQLGTGTTSCSGHFQAWTVLIPIIHFQQYI